MNDEQIKCPKCDSIVIIYKCLACEYCWVSRPEDTLKAVVALLERIKKLERKNND